GRSAFAVAVTTALRLSHYLTRTGAAPTIAGGTSAHRDRPVGANHYRRRTMKRKVIGTAVLSLSVIALATLAQATRPQPSPPCHPNATADMDMPTDRDTGDTRAPRGALALRTYS